MTLRSFLTRLIWLCVLPMLLLAVALAAGHVVDVLGDTDRDAERLARNAVVAVDSEIGARIGALQILASSPLIDDRARWPDLYAEAQGYLHSFGSHVSIGDLDGRMLMHTRVPLGEPLPPLPRPEGRSAARDAAATGRPAVGDLFEGPVSGGPMVAAVAPRVHGGRVTALVITAIPAAQLQRQLAAVTVPPGWGLALLDSRGSVIAASDRPASAAGQGRDFRVALDRAPWSVRLTVPDADHWSPVMAAAAAMLLAVAGATLAAILGGQWAGRRLANAVQALAEPAAPASPALEVEEVTRVRRRLDEASLTLQVREAQLRGIFDSATDAIVTADQSQAIVMANPAAARMFGHPLETLIGAPLDLLIPERYREDHRRQLAAFGETGVSSRHMGKQPDITALRADGTEFPIDAAISHLHVDGQRLYTVIMRDITERQRAERALRDSKAKLEAALAALSDAVFIVDADGRFVDFNDAFATFHRFGSKAECLRTLGEYPALLEVCLPSGEPAPLEQWAVSRALRGESGTNAEFRVRRKDTGEAWYGSFSFAPIRDAQGGIIGAVVTGRDITAAKQSQAELKSAHQALQRLIAAQDRVQEAERTRIARELHDDLQQTLAAILMEVAALRGAAGADPARAAPALARIDALAATAIGSTRRIVRDLRPQILEELGLAAALEALARQFGERTGIDCRFSAEGLDEIGPIEASPVSTCLFRVAQEALNNVAKHADAKQVRICLASDDDGRLDLRIRDDGKGMSEVDRRKLHSFGLLGMSERVRAVGGTLEVSSRPGAGTEVLVEAPLPLDEGSAG